MQHHRVGNLEALVHMQVPLEQAMAKQSIFTLWYATHIALLYTMSGRPVGN